MQKTVLTSLCLAMVVGLLFFGISNNNAYANQGRWIMEERCTTCHHLDRIQRMAYQYDRYGWERTVNRMMGKSSFLAPMTDAEREALINYLASL